MGHIESETTKRPSTHTLDYKSSLYLPDTWTWGVLRKKRTVDVTAGPPPQGCAFALGFPLYNTGSGCSEPVLHMQTLRHRVLGKQCA